MPAEQVAEVVRNCPTGALHYVLVEGEPEQPETPTTITPSKNGLLILQGNLLIDDQPQ